MRHRKTKVTLDRNSAQRQRLVRNLATDLLLKERIVTTEARAKIIRSMAERIITIGKKNTLHHRRMIMQRLPRPEVATKVLETLGPRYQARAGGYTRRLLIARRKGDGAQQVIVELVQ